MKNNLNVILIFGLLAGHMVANADSVQSTTSVHLTFRHCISGETACDSIGPSQVRIYGGRGGKPVAGAEHHDPAFGEASGSAQLSAVAGGASVSAGATSLPATRTGSKSLTLQRYTNAGASKETLTFSGTLTYDQTVPDENAGFPADGSVESGAFAEMEIFTLKVSSFEIGTSSQDNFLALTSEPDTGVGYLSLENANFSGLASNVTGAGTKELSATVTLNPGDSVWVWTMLQALAANGAVVNASLETSLETTLVE